MYDTTFLFFGCTRKRGGLHEYKYMENRGMDMNRGYLSGCRRTRVRLWRGTQRAARRAGLTRGETERQRTSKETGAKLPLQMSESTRKQHGKGVGAFWQQYLRQPNPERSRGIRPD